MPANKKEPRILGVGGVFFKSENPDALKDWYKQHLGFNTDAHGTMFSFLTEEIPHRKGYLQWSPFPRDTDYFSPSTKEFMVNYRVQNIEAMVEKLKAAGVTILDDIASYEYGKFVHLLDGENNKIELWEPVDQVFSESEDGKTK